MGEVVDVAHIIDEQKTGLGHIRIVILCFLMLYLDGIDNLGLAYVAPALGQAWHLSRGALGPVFTAGVTGVAIGALVTGPLADRYGRKSTTIITVVYFALLTLLVTQASNLTELMVLRFLAGLGLGSLVPMAVVIVSEFAPRATRARLVTLASCGYAIGAASGGLIAAQVVPTYGWQGMFYVGGLVPLALAAAMYVWLPESVRLLALRPGNRERIARTLATINPQLRFPDDVTFTLAQEQTEQAPRVIQLFTDGRVAITLLLWFIIFLNTTVLNLLNNWLPTLVNSTGLPQTVALRVASSLQFGGVVGVITMGMLADRFGFFRVLAIASFVGATFVGLIGSVGATATVLAPTIAIAGFCNIGCQITNAAMAATLYPTDIRSTGVNWAHGVARILSTVGPLLGGLLLEYEWPLQKIFLLFAAPMLTACGGILVLQSLVQARNKTRGTSLGARQNVPA
ncbi:MAG TPA: MFS transporter [Vicinamibacterales bacterium]|nr:MFS transporter [Vicinamibacterales bacterium]